MPRGGGVAFVGGYRILLHTSVRRELCIPRLQILRRALSSGAVALGVVSPENFFYNFFSPRQRCKGAEPRDD